MREAIGELRHSQNIAVALPGGAMAQRAAVFGDFLILNRHLNGSLDCQPPLRSLQRSPMISQSKGDLSRVTLAMSTM
jgi:hypothetical protein